MAMINYNTDISNFWEFSGTGFKPVDESNEAYKLGVNYIMYGMTPLKGCDSWNTQSVDLSSADDVALADRMNAGPAADHRRAAASASSGRSDVIEQVLLTLFVGGNSLIVGVPGLAKTLLIADAGAGAGPEVQAHPVHARPDAVRHHRHRHHPGGRRPAGGRWCSRPGRSSRNIVLADEINRTPPKTQSALLEAMQEHRVTIQGRTYKLDEPFFVFATQNPIELEGTYPLPEAQLDRFMFHIVIDHPPEDEEFEVVRTTTAIVDPHVRAAGERARIWSRSSGWCGACRWPSR